MAVKLVIALFTSILIFGSTAIAESDAAVLDPLDAIEQRLSDLEEVAREGQRNARSNSSAVAQLTQALQQTRAVVELNDERIERVIDRLARGDDPLVALEIENMWRRMRTLEEEVAFLTEQLVRSGILE